MNITANHSFGIGKNNKYQRLCVVINRTYCKMSNRTNDQFVTIIDSR